LVYRTSTRFNPPGASRLYDKNPELQDEIRANPLEWWVKEKPE